MTPDRVKGTALYDAVDRRGQPAQREPAAGSRDHRPQRRRRQRQQRLARRPRSRRPARRTHRSTRSGSKARDSPPTPSRSSRARQAASTTEPLRRRTSQASTRRSPRALKKTWRIQYVTAARPGRHIRLTASIVGAGLDDTDREDPRGQDVVGSRAVEASAEERVRPRRPARDRDRGRRCSCSSGVSSSSQGSGARGFAAASSAHTGEGKGKNAKKNRKERRSEAFATIFAATEKALGHLKQWRAISKMLERADVQLRTVEFVWITLGYGRGRRSARVPVRSRSDHPRGR